MVPASIAETPPKMHFLTTPSPDTLTRKTCPEKAGSRAPTLSLQETQMCLNAFCAVDAKGRPQREDSNCTGRVAAQSFTFSKHPERKGALREGGGGNEIPRTPI